MKSFSSEVYISDTKTLSQNLSIIDNRLRQNSEQSGAALGDYYQVLYAGTTENNPAGGSVISPIFTSVSATEADAIVMAITKTPEMRQLVLYFKTYVSDATADGYIKLRGGSLSTESAVIDTLTGEERRALYLDITSLNNWEEMEIQVNMKISGGFTLSMRNISIVVRGDITALAGETSYNANDPVE